MPQTILWNIYEYILGLIEVLLFYDFSNLMLKRDKNIKKSILLLVYCIVIDFYIYIN